MKNGLLTINVPRLYNPYDRDEILCAFETLVLCAYRIAGVIDVGYMVSELSDLHENNCDPVDIYENSHDELFGLISGYNNRIAKNNSMFPKIRLVVDEEKTEMLGKHCKYPIYMVIYVND